MVSLKVPGLMCDSFYNSGTLNTNGEGVTAWGAAAQWLWVSGDRGRGSGSRPGTVGLCHCQVSLLCLFLWMAQVIHTCGYPTVCSIPIYPRVCCGLVPASSPLLPVVLYRAATKSHCIGHFPLCQRPLPGVCLDPLRKDSCFHTCSALCQGLCS